jgi:VanZ family protein
MYDIAPFLARLPPPLCLALSALYMAGIYVLSGLEISFPETGHPWLWSFLGNLFHFPLYTGLGLLLLLGFRSWRRGETAELGTGAALSALAVLALYGAFDEVHQSWTGRTPALSDFMLDICGGLAALLILKTVLEKRIGLRAFLALFALLTAAACALVLLAA